MIDSTHHARVSVRVAYTVIAVFVSATAAAALDLLLLLCDLSHVFFPSRLRLFFLRFMRVGGARLLIDGHDSSVNDRGR